MKPKYGKVKIDNMNSPWIYQKAIIISEKKLNFVDFQKKLIKTFVSIWMVFFILKSKSWSYYFFSTVFQEKSRNKQKWKSIKKVIYSISFPEINQNGLI